MHLCALMEALNCQLAVSFVGGAQMAVSADNLTFFLLLSGCIFFITVHNMKWCHQLRPSLEEGRRKVGLGVTARRRGTTRPVLKL